MQDNRVFLNYDGIIIIDVVGDQVISSIVAMGTAITQLVDQLTQDNKPVLILDNLNHMGKVPPEGRKLVIELAKTIPYERLAMVGSNPALKNWC